jgi:predicted GH43/DUF377 family glycosyl hydrolase
MSNQRIYIQLGKAGDVINLLPLLYLDAQEGKRAAFMVAKDYGSILEGCSYLDPIIFDGHPYELDRAVLLAKSRSDDVKCCQINGPPELVKKFSYEPAGYDKARTGSFLKESWNIAGRLADWAAQPPLVFDRRNPEREAALVDSVIARGREPILVATGGQTSPFPYLDLLLELLRLRFLRRRPVIDLGKVEAEKIYDLLGLFEKAHCLVATDSAPLQLARACEVPVVALVNDRPLLWNGSDWRPNHVCHIRYRDFPRRAIEMLAAIEGIGDPGFVKPVGRKIIHAWSGYEESEANKDRRAQAVATWEPLYRDGRWWSTCIEVGALGKDSRYSDLGDTQRYPFVRDVIRLACERADADDLICLTRCDTAFVHSLTPRLLSDAPCWSHRILRATGEDDNGHTFHPAVDLFCFSKAWWIENQGEYPAGMVLGLDHHWYRILLEIMRLRGGRELREAVWRDHPKETKAKDAPKYVGHNEKLAKDWLSFRQISSLYPKVTEQAERVPLNRLALYSFGYNPSIIRHKGRVLMAYRYHPEETPATALAIAELDEKFNVTSNQTIRAEHAGFRSVEDPRLFEHNGQLWISYVVSTWPETPPRCAVRFGRLAEGSAWTIEGATQPAIGKNDGSAMEKNWIFYETAGRLNCVYEVAPTLRRWVLVDKNWSELTPRKGQRPWRWGPIHGGTVPIPLGNSGQSISFFHSKLVNEPLPVRWRYYVGARIIQDEETMRISKPLLIGSEEDNTSGIDRTSCTHRKPNVVFPGGAIACEGGWILSVGINDCCCALVKIPSTLPDFL